MRRAPSFHFVIASEAKQSRATKKDWIASSQALLAMTGSGVCGRTLNVIASAAKQSRATHAGWTASSQGLLAMTNLRIFAYPEHCL
jgi:hypothetical protein